jgi:hypothetical protein
MGYVEKNRRLVRAARVLLRLQHRRLATAWARWETQWHEEKRMRHAAVLRRRQNPALALVSGAGRWRDVRQHGDLTADRLESDAIQWQPESCEFACRPPWISTRRSAYATDVQNTCVLCENLDGSALCPIGQYPHGPYCECSECEL